MPNAVATHERAASFRQQSPVTKQRILAKSMRHYATKHLGYITGEAVIYSFGVVSIMLAVLQQLFKLSKPRRAKNL